jgi:hypothetical protein
LEAEVALKRDLIISRIYNKGSEMRALHLAEVSGEDFSGTVYQFEEWLNNQELPGSRLTSGNQYAVRKKFINTLLDLHEGGWNRSNASSYGHKQVSFFDPSNL